MPARRPYADASFILTPTSLPPSLVSLPPSLTHSQGAANTASWVVALISVVVYTAYMKNWRYRTTLFLMQLLVFSISALDIVLVGVAKDAFWCAARTECGALPLPAAAPSLTARRPRR